VSDNDDEAYLAAVEAMLSAEGMVEAAELLRTADTEVVEAGYDNWNRGTRLYTVVLAIDPAEYGRLGAKREFLQEQISARVRAVFEQDNNTAFSAAIRPRIRARPDWRTTPATLTRRARRNIIDGIKVEGITWMGALSDVEFLQRLWDLKALPSTDGRFEDAAGDIWQHRFNNDDWEDDWIFEDERFNLVDGSADRFLAFLEMVHPVVRPDRNQALEIVRGLQRSTPS
jgi:hypothetical protein